MNILMIIAVFLPMVTGAVLPFVRLGSRKNKLALTGAVLAAEAVIAVILAAGTSNEFTLFSMTEILTVSLKIDNLSRLFLIVFSFGFLLAGIFAFKYTEHEEAEGSFKEEMFYAFYLLTLGAMIGISMAHNLVAMYLFFELVTILSMPLVLFEKTEQSINAALKYLFYSVGGAFMALFCIFTLAQYTTTLEFVKGGTLDTALVEGHTGLVLAAVFAGVVGFGAKAGMYPLHGWLPTAHPVAPAPASAVLSGLITKAGVLSIIRVIYFVAGPEFLAGTWVQMVWIGLSLITVFMGSMMAYREKVLKKRLAYSSVSQISYVLFGLFLMNEIALKGALMQIVFHATVKVGLFLFAGSIIFNTHCHNVDELTGFGKSMPVTFICFTMGSLSLIGIPPFAGFVSKWYLAKGALASGIAVYSYLGPVVLLLSALLTAGYLLPVTIHGFFPGKDFKAEKNYSEGGMLMKAPLMILAALALLMGVCGGFLSPFFDAVVSAVI